MSFFFFQYFKNVSPLFFWFASFIEKSDVYVPFFLWLLLTFFFLQLVFSNFVNTVPWHSFLYFYFYWSSLSFLDLWVYSFYQF